MSDETENITPVPFDEESDAAILREQDALNRAVLEAQVAHLSVRVAELVREVVQLRKDQSSA